MSFFDQLRPKPHISKEAFVELQDVVDMEIEDEAEEKERKKTEKIREDTKKRKRTMKRTIIKEIEKGEKKLQIEKIT